MKIAELKIEVERIRFEMTEHVNQIANFHHKADFSVSLTSIKKLEEAIRRIGDARQALFDI